MTSSRRRAALYAAVNSARRYACEVLEGRVLLSGDPSDDAVLVLVEPVQDFRVNDVLPYLWTSPVETSFDPHVGGSPDGEDRDGNGSEKGVGSLFLEKTPDPFFCFTVTAPSATINGGNGNDTVYTGNTGSYYAQLGAGTNSYFGGNGTDYVLLASGAYGTIFLGGGNDTVDAQNDPTNNDYINGGSGTDTLLILTGLTRTLLVSVEQIIGV